MKETSAEKDSKVDRIEGGYGISEWWMGVSQKTRHL
jgi:hypothetical protein